MKKIITILIICLAIIFCCNCQKVQEDTEATSKESMFVVVEKTELWKVVYHKETKVMYIISFGYYNSGTFTLMVDENGMPLLWQGE